MSLVTREGWGKPYELHMNASCVMLPNVQSCISQRHSCSESTGGKRQSLSPFKIIINRIAIMLNKEEREISTFAFVLVFQFYLQREEREFIMPILEKSQAKCTRTQLIFLSRIIIRMTKLNLLIKIMVREQTPLMNLSGLKVNENPTGKNLFHQIHITLIRM